MNARKTLFVAMIAMAVEGAHADNAHWYVDVPWHCPQTLQTKDVPTTMDFRLSVAENGKTDLAPLEDFIKQLETRYPQYNFANCFVRAIAGLDGVASKEARARAYNAVSILAMKYAQRAEGQRAMSYVEPNAMLQAPLGPIAAGLVADGQQLLAPAELLSGNFLSILRDYEPARPALLPEKQKAGLTALFAAQLKRTLPDELSCEKWPEACAKRIKSARETLLKLSELEVFPLGYPVGETSGSKPCPTDLSHLQDELAGFSRKLSVAASQDRFCSLPSARETIYRNISALRRRPDREAKEPEVTMSGRKIARGEKLEEYVIDITFAFKFEKGINEESRAKFRERLWNCYEKVNPKLRGPDGEFLSLNYIPARPSDLSAATVKIKKGVRRADQTLWGLDAPCQTLIHETFHWLGLKDEYREQSIGQRVIRGLLIGTESDPDFPSYSCRFEGPPDSVMSNHLTAFYASQVKTLNWFEKLFEPRAIANPLIRPSLLYPAQFRKLLRPNCVAMNEKYDFCTELAYATGFGGTNEGCPQDRVSKRYCKDYWK